MIEIKRIDHINLIVSSLQRAREYYERVFGFEIVPRENTPQTLVVESEHVHFFITQVENVPEAVMRNQHVSFGVENLDSVIEALDRLLHSRIRSAVAIRPGMPHQRPEGAGW